MITYNFLPNLDHFSISACVFAFLHWFEVGGALLVKSDVMYLFAQIRIKQSLNLNLMIASLCCQATVSQI